MAARQVRATATNSFTGRTASRPAVIRLANEAVLEGSIMSFYRATLVALTTVMTVGLTSAAFACCEWPAPVVYGAAGCGGCGAVFAPTAYTVPVPPVAVAVGGCGGCGALAPVAVATWGNGCGGCGGPVVYGAPAIEPTPIAPAPIYVVNQGPEYAGPGIVVPYRVYTPSAAYGPASYPYVPGYAPGPYYRPHIDYRPHWHGYPYPYRPVRTLD